MKAVSAGIAAPVGCCGEGMIAMSMLERGSRLCRHIAAGGAWMAACVMMFVAVSTANAEYRSIDGSWNNLSDPTLGAAGTALMRMAWPEYGDGMNTPSGDTRPNPRTISNTIFNQPTSLPNTFSLSSMVWVWGQFIDHDLDLTTESHPIEMFSINIPAGDPAFDPFWTGSASIPLMRSVYDHTTGTDPSNPRQQLNMITSYIDGSNVYGSDQARADYLRTFSDGMLKTTSHATGDLLPFNLDGFANGSLPGQDPTSMFIAGDVRANENIALTAMHTLFVREHNRIAAEYAAKHAGASDEEIYQYARKIVGAQLQAITYNEFLPSLGIQLNPYTGYDSLVNPSIMNEFSTAAFRIGHTMVVPLLLRLSESGESIAEGPIALHDAFFSPSRILDEGGIDPILRGLAAQPQQEIDSKIIDGLRNFLFGPPGAGGMDLASLNIQRGRDHGLPDINDVRSAFGLSPFAAFDELTSNEDMIIDLQSLYGSIDLMDPWVAMLIEDPMLGSPLGSTLHAIIASQFQALRDGDRFFYLNDLALSLDEIEDIGQTTLADIILRNTQIISLQDNVFHVATPEPAVGLLTLAAVGGLAVRRRRHRP